ncbi:MULTISPECIES: TraB/GumN family protein [unclassified Sphingomonas]|uniref:TraB/GumN family protein n=1 Tax=unclassified Sphingomonas TaxID=196159 RepID=UPI000BD6ADDA|nr:MAG: hypothetical protein B7Y98_03125 [Sphingomonas sp. 32-62-10]
MIPSRVAFLPHQRAFLRRPLATLAAMVLAAAIGPVDAGLARQRPRLAYHTPRDDDAVSRSGAPQLRYPGPDRDDGLSLARKAIPPVEGTVRLAQLSQNYRPRPAIWRIGDRDTAIYLIGTIHTLPPGFAWRTAALDRIVARSRLLILESIEDSASKAATDASFVEDPMLPPLTARVDAGHRAKLAAFVASLPPATARLMDQMPSWIASVAIALVNEVRSGELPGPGADDWLEEQFRTANKPIVAIEDNRQVLAAVNAVPEGDQQRMLHAAIDAPVRSRADMRAAIHAWAKGDVGPDSALSVDLVATTGSAAMAAPLLTDRNSAWTRALIRQLKTPGTMLFAAGAGHFIGTGSVIEQLETRGVRVSRVQ